MTHICAKLPQIVTTKKKSIFFGDKTQKNFSKISRFKFSFFQRWRQNTIDLYWPNINQWQNHHHHFAAGIGIFFLFLEPSKFSWQSRVSKFLQQSLHLARFCASNLCKPATVMSQSTTSFHFLLAFMF